MLRHAHKKWLLIAGNVDLERVASYSATAEVSRDSENDTKNTSLLVPSPIEGCVGCLRKRMADHEIGTRECVWPRRWMLYRDVMVRVGITIRWSQSFRRMATFARQLRNRRSGALAARRRTDGR